MACSSSVGNTVNHLMTGENLTLNNVNLPPTAEVCTKTVDLGRTSTLLGRCTRSTVFRSNKVNRAIGLLFNGLYDVHFWNHFGSYSVYPILNHLDWVHTEIKSLSFSS